MIIARLEVIRKMKDMMYAGRVIRVLDPITYEVMVDMGLGITYTCRVKMAGVKYRKYDRDDQAEYEDFLTTKDNIRIDLLGKDLIIKFVTDFKDKSGKYLVDLKDSDTWLSEKYVKEGSLERLES